MMDPSRHYGQIAAAMRGVEAGLRHWATQHLRLAGIEKLPVLSDFQPFSGPALVLFPYQVGPDPKLREQSLVYNLQQVSYPWVQGTVTDARGKNLPPAWNAVGLALNRGLELLQELYGAPDLPRPTRQPVHRGAYFDPHRLPEALKVWFERPTDDPALRWRRELVVMRGEQRAFLNPFLGWQTGFTIAINYLGLMDVGSEQTQAATRESALPALAVLMGSVHRERMMRAEVPPRPIPDELTGYLEAVRDSLPKKSREYEDMAEALRRIQLPELLDISLDPVQDLTDETVALVMRAVQRPLRPYINLRLRVRLGDGPEIGAAPSPDMLNAMDVSSNSERVRSASSAESLEKPVGWGARKDDGATPREGGREPSRETAREPAREVVRETPRKVETYEDFQARAREEAQRRLSELREHPLYADLPSASLDEDERG